MFENLTPDELHRAAKREFAETTDHYSEWINWVEEDQDFYHNDQWSDDDLAYLKKQGRPALTFNIVQAKVLHMLGANFDNSRAPIVTPEGKGDRFAADVINRALRSIVKQADQERIDETVFEDGIVSGIGHAALDLMPHEDDLNRLQFKMEVARPTEVFHDPVAREKDRSDARFLFWSRWLTRGQVMHEYPEMSEDEINDLFNENEWSVISDSWRPPVITHQSPVDWLSRPLRPDLFFDKRRHRVRVVHMEYLKAEDQNVVLLPDGTQRIVSGERARVLGTLKPGATEIVKQVVTRVNWLEFTGRNVLFDEPSPMPWDGFSVRSWVCQQDRNNLPYGKVRILKDPQREVNKRYSTTLHHLSMQADPGTTAEQGALVDEKQAESAMRSGGLVLVNPGKMQAVRERTPPQLPQATVEMTKMSISFLDIISTVHVDELMEPRGIPEAAATSQLKHRKSMMSTTPLLRGFHHYQKGVAKIWIDVLTSAVSDEQIKDLLSNEDQFAISDRIVMNVETKEFMRLDDIRRIRSDVEVVPDSEGNMQAIMNMQILAGLQQSQVPVDPMVMIECSTLPQDKKERMKAFVRQTQASQARAAQEQQQQLTKQLTTQNVIEVEKIKEERRSNEADEFLSGHRQMSKMLVDLMKVFIDADENEKARVVDLFKEISKQQGERKVDDGAEAESA